MTDFEELKKRTEELLKKAASAGTATLTERAAPILVAKDEELRKREGVVAAKEKELDEKKRSLDEVATNQAQIDEALKVREEMIKVQEAEMAEVRALAGVIKRIIEEMDLRSELETRGIWPEFEKYLEEVK